MLEVYLFFFQSVIPTLTNANKFLQQEQPLIHILLSRLVSLIKKILTKFVKPSCIADSESSLVSFSFDEESCLLAFGDIWIGFQTKQLLSKLLIDGDMLVPSS